MLYWYIYKTGKSDIIYRNNHRNIKTYESGSRNAHAMARVLNYYKKYEWDFCTGKGAKTTLYWRVICHNLTYYWKSIRNSLEAAGYNDITLPRLSGEIKRGNAGDYDYIVNGDGVCYGINLYIDDNRTMQIINGDILTGDNGLNDIDEMIQLSEMVYEVAGADGLTLATVAYKSLKNTLHENSAKDILRHCEKFILKDTGETEDEYIRPSFQGGFNVLKKPGAYPGGVLVLDVNSLYPYIFKTGKLPTGKPFYGGGKPPEKLFNGIYCGYIRFLAKLQLKPGKIPFIRPQKDGDKVLIGNRGEIISHTKYYSTIEHNFVDRETELILTFEEFKLMLEHYNCKIRFIDYLYYRSCSNIWGAWVDNLYSIKSTETGHRRKAAKQILNSAVGSLSKKRERESVYFDEAGELKPIKTEVKSPSHIYIGAYVLSLARVKVIKDAQKNYKRYIYSDTDSIHLAGTELPENINIGPGLGNYKIEHRTGEGAYYWARKNYAIKEGGAWHITAAGLPEDGRAILEEILDGKRDGYRPLEKYHTEWAKKTADAAKWRAILESSGRKTEPEPLDFKDLDNMKQILPVEVWTQSEDWKPHKQKLLWEFDPMKARKKVYKKFIKKTHF